MWIIYMMENMLKIPQLFLQIALAEINENLGTGFGPPLIYIGYFTVINHSFAIMKSNTLKFILPCGINVIKFGGNDEEIENIENMIIIFNIIIKN